MSMLLFLAAAAAAGSADDSAYLACYREVLAEPRFASQTPEQLDEARGRIASAVIEKCDRFLKQARKDAEAAVREGERLGRQMGDTENLPRGMFKGFVELRLGIAVGKDLDRAEPRMKGLVDARLRERADAARKVEADAETEAKDAALVAGSGRIEWLAGAELYDRCLDRQIVRAARTDIADGEVFAAALAACAGTRARIAPEGDRMAGPMTTSSENAKRDRAPDLIRTLRAVPAPE